MPQFPAPRRSTQPRVQHIPADHPYVRHLEAVPGEPSLFRSLPDPVEPVARPGWHPSPALDPAWLRARAGEIDVVHLHFGYEHLDAGQVEDWAAVVHDVGASLVVTVHDLDNPHLVDQSRHHRAVGAALAAADRVLTLTPGAATQIRQRWGRTAEVVVHPHVFPLDLVERRSMPRSAGGVPRVGIPLGSLRANVVAEQVLALVAQLPDVGLRIRVSRQALEPGFRRGEARAVQHPLERGVEEGRWQLHVVDAGEPEEQVWQWVSSLDAMILPYGWGTHSAWVEACADVGTAVIAPGVGFWHEQHSVLTVPSWSKATALQVSQALHRVRENGGDALSATDRRQERQRVHAAHAAVYRSCLRTPV